MDGEGEPTSFPKKASPIKNNLWSDDSFDSIKFTNALLPLLEDFLGDYKEVHNQPFPKRSNLKKAHLIRVLLVEQINREEHDKANNE